jgi:hypothetical protein
VIVVRDGAVGFEGGDYVWQHDDVPRIRFLASGIRLLSSDPRLLRTGVLSLSETFAVSASCPSHPAGVSR